MDCHKIKNVPPPQSAILKAEEELNLTTIKHRHKDDSQYLVTLPSLATCSTRKEMMRWFYFQASLMVILPGKSGMFIHEPDLPPVCVLQ